ncbi:unnamed protein product, partial [marine sediment metagenome]
GLSGTLTQIIPLAGFAGAIGAAILVYFIASSGGRLTIPRIRRGILILNRITAAGVFSRG